MVLVKARRDFLRTNHCAGLSGLGSDYYCFNVRQPAFTVAETLKGLPRLQLSI